MAGSRLSVTDVRNPGQEIDVELTARQGTAVGALLACSGSGSFRDGA
jgi:hypothetical protein